MPPFEVLPSLLSRNETATAVLIALLLLVTVLLGLLLRQRRRHDPCAYGPAFRALRAAVLARSNHRCVGCGSRRGLQLHHITSGPYPCGCARRSGSACNRRAVVTAADLAPLCPLCHDAVTIVRRMLRTRPRAAVAVALKARLAWLPRR